MVFPPACIISLLIAIYEVYEWGTPIDLADYLFAFISLLLWLLAPAWIGTLFGVANLVYGLVMLSE